jgi:transcriptional regulator of aromatic amino acid metabolism
MPWSADCRALINAMSMPVFVVHADGHIEWLNRRASQLLGDRVPKTIKCLLASPSRSEEFLRAMRRNQAFSHLALHLGAPMQDSYIASTRIARQGEVLDFWLRSCCQDSG